MITSRQNPKIALLRSLSRSKKARGEAGVFAVEGEKLFFEAVLSGLEPQNLLITEKFSQKNDNFRKKAENLCNIDIISDDLAEYISDTKTPSGVFFTLPLLDKTLNMNTMYNEGVYSFVALDAVQDPGNVGAIIRSCDAFGIDSLFLSGGCADINSPKLIRSAMGSVFRLPVYRCELSPLILRLKEKGFCIIGADCGGERCLSADEFKFPQKSLVIIGSEGGGISPEIIKLCTERIYIPVKNVESLNAAVAASIIIYKMQHRDGFYSPE
ncbi:MAG: RNA methyltransferase [Oscillospiraceae bacterium]|nr:RNA methyltransferase [Oscillospiraceae bacterium]